LNDGDDRDQRKESLSKSRIEYDLTTSKPFLHEEYERYVKQSLEKRKDSKLRAQGKTSSLRYRDSSYDNRIDIVLMLTGTSAIGYKLNQYMYMSISKSYYAARHGYQYLMTTSPQYVDYYPRHLYGVSSISCLPSAIGWMIVLSYVFRKFNMK
jgi:hypothetical protein